MANANTPAKMDEASQAKAEVATITDAKLLEQFAEYAVMIPAEAGSGTESILAKILQATTWDQLDQPWETSDVTDILGKRLKVTAVTRRPSTFAGGLGIFLVVSLTDIKTGQEYVKTTGSIAVVGQIAAAYARGWMPLLVEWCRSERPTEAGYYPQHLKVLDSFASANGNA